MKFKAVISFAPPRSHRSIGLSSRGHFDHFFWAPPGSHRSIGFSTFGRTHRQVYFLEIDMATWPKGPQKLKFEHAICILKLLILSRGSLWPVLAAELTFLGCVRTYFLTRLTPGWRKYATQTPSNYINILQHFFTIIFTTRPKAEFTGVVRGGGGPPAIIIHY